MNSFTYFYPTKVYFGAGSAREALSAELEKYGDTVLFVYGGGSVKKNGVYDEVYALLRQAGKTVVEFSGIMPNPTYAVEVGDDYRLILGYTEDVSRFNYGFVHGSKTKIGNLIVGWNEAGQTITVVPIVPNLSACGDPTYYRRSEIFKACRNKYPTDAFIIYPDKKAISASMPMIGWKMKSCMFMYHRMMNWPLLPTSLYTDLQRNEVGDTSRRSWRVPAGPLSPYLICRKTELRTGRSKRHIACFDFFAGNSRGKTSKPEVLSTGGALLLVGMCPDGPRIKVRKKNMLRAKNHLLPGGGGQWNECSA